MAGFLTKLFPGLFPDPIQVSMARKTRINSALRRFEQEVRTQDRYIKDYLNQAVSNQRTGDTQGYAQVKKMIAFSFAARKRAQRGLNTLRLFSTMSDQMSAYGDFSTAISAISQEMGEVFANTDMSKTMQELQMGMDKAENMQQMVDVALDAFDSAIDSKMPDDLNMAGVKNDDLDALIGQLAKDRDSLTEDKIAQVLSQAEKASNGQRSL